MTQQKQKIVVVTGSTGIIGSEIVRELLEQYDNMLVRATVRDPDNKKCDFLKDLQKKAASSDNKRNTTLELHTGDLTKAGSFDTAIKGADVVIATAAVVQMHFEKCPFKEVIDPAIEGTRDIALTCKKHGIKRIVYTSSVSTIVQLEENRQPKYRGKPFVEEERRFDLRPSYATYQCAKMISEQVLYENFPDGEVISILPTWTIGHTPCGLATSSHQLIKALANKEMGMAPLLYSSYVDLEDVARSHIHAAFCPFPSSSSSSSSSATSASAGGGGGGGEGESSSKKHRRYIVSQGELYSSLDFAKAIGKMFPHLSPPTAMTPWWLLWVVSWWDKRIGAFVLNEKSQKLPPFDGTKITRELGFEYKGKKLEDSIKKCVDCLIASGHVKAAPQSKKD